jgi:hypothetical protein
VWIVIIVLAKYVGVAVVGWLAGLLTLAPLLHGRACVWAQTRAACRARRRSLLGEWIPPNADQPIAVAPRGGWLR